MLRCDMHRPYGVGAQETSSTYLVNLEVKRVVQFEVTATSREEAKVSARTTYANSGKYEELEGPYVTVCEVDRV